MGNRMMELEGREKWAAMKRERMIKEAGKEEEAAGSVVLSSGLSAGMS